MKGKWFSTGCNNTQHKSLVSQTLTAYYWMPIVVALALLAFSAGPAHALELQINSNAPYVCAAVEGGSSMPGTPVIA